jgi:hypothetical protein
MLSCWTWCFLTFSALSACLSRLTLISSLTRRALLS